MRPTLSAALIIALAAFAAPLHAQINTLGATSSFGTPISEVEDAAAAAAEAAAADTAAGPEQQTQLARAAEDGAEALLELLQDSAFAVPVGSDAAAAAIDTLATYVRPLPAARAEANWRGYAALLRLDPENAIYADKAERYKDAFERARYAALGKLKKKTDDFSGTTWYEHPNTPHYADTRHYIEVYMGENAGKIIMRFQLHYTSDSWLFIDSARAKIDGEFVNIPMGDWKRDNDTEIWEWSDVVLNDNLRTIAERIANSRETIIRFEGRQYYDDMTVRSSDKQAILDVFSAEQALIEKLASR